MEIEPEVIDPDGRRRGPVPPEVPKWKLALAGAAGLVVLVAIAWIAIWLALILIGIGLVAWLVRKVLGFFTGTPPGSSSSVRIVIRRPPGG
jgi:hypothetical protein